VYKRNKNVVTPAPVDEEQALRPVTADPTKHQESAAPEPCNWQFLRSKCFIAAAVALILIVVIVSVFVTATGGGGGDGGRDGGGDGGVQN